MGDRLRSVANEIPLLLILFYLRRNSARPICGLFWVQLERNVSGVVRSFARAHCTHSSLGAARRTDLGGEFGWGGTSSTRQRRCPKISSVRTEISRSAKG